VFFCGGLAIVIFYLSPNSNFNAFRKKDATWQIPDPEKVRFAHYTYLFTFIIQCELKITRQIKPDANRLASHVVPPPWEHHHIFIPHP